MIYKIGQRVTLYKNGHYPIIIRKCVSGWEHLKHVDMYKTEYWEGLPQSDECIERNIAEYSKKPANWIEPIRLSQVGKQMKMQLEVDL